jgi:hypothetical protein
MYQNTCFGKEKAKKVDPVSITVDEEVTVENSIVFIFL